MHFGSAAIPVGWRHAWTTGVVAAVTSSAGQAAAARLAGTRFADVRWVDETASTNADVLGLARDGEAEGIVVVADHQTAGRGRLGRTWTAAPGHVAAVHRPAPPAGGGRERHDDGRGGGAGRGGRPW